MLDHNPRVSYHGYIPFIKQHLTKLTAPRVLEVGLSTGITTIPLLIFMARYHDSFEFTGVDITFEESLVIILKNVDFAPTHRARLVQGNSLEILPKLSEAKEKFDVVLLDGDHNYYTVSKELQHLNNITHENSIVLIDDYHGKWSERDLWYSEREGYEKVDLATKKVPTEKHGVKPAVDEFLASNPGWKMTTLMQGEPVLLQRESNSSGVFGKSIFEP